MIRCYTPGGIHPSPLIYFIISNMTKEALFDHEMSPTNLFLVTDLWRSNHWIHFVIEITILADTIPVSTPAWMGSVRIRTGVLSISWLCNNTGLMFIHQQMYVTKCVSVHSCILPQRAHRPAQRSSGCRHINQTVTVPDFMIYCDYRSHLSDQDKTMHPNVNI